MLEGKETILGLDKSSSGSPSSESRAVRLEFTSEGGKAEYHMVEKIIRR